MTNHIAAKPHSDNTLTVKQIITRIALIVFVLALLVSLTLTLFPLQKGTLLEAILEPILLVCLCTPAIYFFVIQPFVAASDGVMTEVNQLAHTDPLTKLANRRLVLDCLAVQVADNGKRGDYGVLLLIDLDNFKSINDHHGHNAGDAVLVEVAERLARCVRAEDIVGRLGGDEFVILLRRLGSDEKIARYVAQFVANKLILQLAQPFSYQNNALVIGASVGARLFTTEQDISNLVIDADAALYRAKEAGKGCVVFFDEPEVTGKKTVKIKQ